MRSEAKHPGASLRATAARLGARVLRDGVSLPQVLDSAPEAAERDRGLLRALVYGSLRWHHRLDWQLGRLLTRRLAPKDVELGVLLRVGLFELQFLRVPEHATVSSCVDASEQLGLGRAKGLVNAVLRRYLRERAALDEAMQSEPVALYSHPRWLIEALQADWPDAWPDMLAANNEPPPMWLRVNSRRIERDAYRARLEAAGLEATVHAALPSGLLLAAPCPVASLPGFAEGLVSVQDGGAQLAAGYLRLGPGLRVLDACAAPGGKTAHMLELEPGLGVLWALDRDRERLASVARNLERLGLEARLVAADARVLESWWDGQPFDRILLDAPCSALGVIRRHPDIKLLRRASDVAAAVELQAELLQSLWAVLAPGGRLVYATCSVLKAENEDQIAAFLEQVPEARLAAPGPRQLLPGEANMDGFYYACLDKPLEQGPRVSSRQQ